MPHTKLSEALHTNALLHEFASYNHLGYIRALCIAETFPFRHQTTFNMSFNAQQQGAFWDFVRSISENANANATQAEHVAQQATHQAGQEADRATQADQRAEQQTDRARQSNPWSAFNWEDFARGFQPPPPHGPPPPSAHPHPPHRPWGRHGPHRYSSDDEQQQPSGSFDRFAPGPDKRRHRFEEDYSDGEGFEGRRRHHGRFGGRGRGGRRMSHSRERSDAEKDMRPEIADENQNPGEASDRGPKRFGGRNHSHGRHRMGGPPGPHGMRGGHRGCGGGRGRHEHGGPRGGPHDRHGHCGGRGGPHGRHGSAGAFDMSGLFRALSSHPVAQALSSHPMAQAYLAPFMPPAYPSVDMQEGVNNDETLFPAVDIFNTSSSYVLHVSLPGAKKEDIGVNWDTDKGELNIAGVIYRQGDEEFIQSLTQAERRVGVFERNIALPPVDASGEREEVEIDGDDIAAKLEDGVLTVTVRKIEREWTDVKKVNID